MNKYLLLALLPFILAFAPVRSGDGDIPTSTISINGTKFYQVDEITIDLFEMGGDVEFDIKGKIRLRGEEVMFMITIPSLTEAEYSKESEGSLASVSLDLGSTYLSSSGPFVPGLDDLGDHVIEITEVNEQTISGYFSANLQEGTSTHTLRIGGEFVVKNSLSKASEAQLLEE